MSIGSRIPEAIVVDVMECRSYSRFKTVALFGKESQNVSPSLGTAIQSKRAFWP